MLTTQVVSYFIESKETYDRTIQHKIEGNFSGGLELTATLDHPEYKLNRDGLSTWRLEGSEQGWKYPSSGDITSSTLVIPVEAPGWETSVILNLTIKVYLCSKSHGLCLSQSLLHKLKISHRPEASSVGSVYLGSLIK